MSFSRGSALALLCAGWLCLDACQQSAPPAAGPPALVEPSDPSDACSNDGQIALYQRKIEPILNDQQPVTCNQCHLAGIDLSLFVRATPCQTMACLEQLGLVNLTQPETSTVLTWIGRTKPQSTLITAAVIQQEHDAFLEWIEYSASCGAQLCPTFGDACNDAQTSSATACAVAEHTDAGVIDASNCQELELEQLFTSDVYAWRERCYPCHFSSDTTVTSAPKWITDVAKGATTANVACATSSLETMHTVLSFGLVDLQTPERSLLLQKPLDMPGSGVTHGGGPKFDSPNDPAYGSFLDWIQRYAACSAQDPSLLKAAPPPTAATTPADAGPDTSILAYCNCLLSNCHDESHQKWGATDEELLAGCRSEALNVPSNGAPITSGNFIECRVGYCKQSLQDSQFCSAALGQTVCL